MGWRTEDGALNEVRNFLELSADELDTINRFGIHDDEIERDRHDGRIVSGRMVKTKSGSQWLVIALWKSAQGDSMVKLCKPDKPSTTTSKPIGELTLVVDTDGDNVA